MTVEFRIGDVRELLAEMPDGSVDLIATSWPYLAQRSYLPADHPMKRYEIGQESTPAKFISTLLEVTAGFRRVLAPHGSIATELGDGFSGSGGAGGDYNENGLREGQQKFDGSGRKRTHHSNGRDWPQRPGLNFKDSRDGWPLGRSLVMAPELYRVALAYGVHPLTGEPSPAGRWRVRNVVVHGRPNPPVGALCVDDQTEALTPDGWRKHNQLEDGDLIAAYDPKTDSCRYLPAKFVKWEREGEPMVVIDKRSTSQVMTEDHRCWVKTRKAPPHVRLAKDLTNDCETLLCAPFDDIAGPAPVTTERAALLGWFIAEGTQHHRQARIVQSLTANPQKVAEIRGLLERDGTDFRESVYQRNLPRQGRNIGKDEDYQTVTFHIKGELAEWLNLHHKRLPMAYVTTWPEAQARALFNALIDGDGHRKHHNALSFHQQKEDVADAMQVLAIRLGYRATKFWQPGGRIWHISMSDSPVQDRRWTKIRNWDHGYPGLGRETYTGTVWCPMVETSFWLARRNGKTFITGNSDKWRPACSYWAVACTGRRWFDLDAVRSPGASYSRTTGNPNGHKGLEREDVRKWDDHLETNLAGAPPLDWFEDEGDHFEQDLWTLPTAPYPGSHYATFSPELIRRFIVSMCPPRVCRECGKPSVRLTKSTVWDHKAHPIEANGIQRGGLGTHGARRAKPETLGWSDCGCGAGCRPTTWRWDVTEVLQGREKDGKWYAIDFFDKPPAETRVKRTRVRVVDDVGNCADPSHWRPGLVLDPFGGSGTTGMVAAGNGRDALLFDLDERCEALARERIGLYLEELAKPQPEPPAPDHEQEAML